MGLVGRNMAVLLGGRAAEHVVFEHLSTGAADDLNKATEIARSMVMRYGMVAELGHVTYDSEPAVFLGNAAPGLKNRTYSEDTAREIDTAVKGLVQNVFEQAHKIVERNRKQLDRGAELLLSKETLDEAELKALFKEVDYRSPVAGAASEQQGS